MNERISDFKGQGALEYLLILGIAIIVVAIIIVFVLSVLETPAETTDEAGDTIISGLDSLLGRVTSYDLLMFAQGEYGFTPSEGTGQLNISYNNENEQWETQYGEETISGSELIDVVNKILEKEGKPKTTTQQLNIKDPCKDSPGTTYHPIYGCVL